MAKEIGSKPTTKRNDRSKTAIVRSLVTRQDILIVVLLISAVPLAGWGLRDRVVALAPLSYLPLMPFAIAVLTMASVTPVGWWRRFAMLVGTLTLVASLSAMVGWRTMPSQIGVGAKLRVVQQNIWWGGGSKHSDETWAAIRRALVARNADILILSEAPPMPEMQKLAADLRDPDPWSMAHIENPPGDSYWYRTVVLSRAPHTAVKQVALPDGVGLRIDVLRPQGRVRVLAVDARSHPSRDRHRMSGALQRYLDSEAEAGRTIDILAGDFNTPSRSSALDSLRRSYWLTLEHCGQWQGTWPTGVPWLVIDHIWVSNSWVGKSCELFTPPFADHRGQEALLLRPDTD